MLLVPGKESCAETRPRMGNCICKMATKGQGGGMDKSTLEAQGKRPYSKALKRRPSLGIGSVCFSNGLGGSLNYLLASDKFCNNHFAKVQDIPLAASEWSYHASDSISTSKDPPDASPKPCALDTASRTQETKEEGDRLPTEELRVRKRVERKCRHHKLGKAFDREMLREAQYLSLLDKMDLETQEDLDRWYSLGSRKLVK
ncbi:uncharacterized protein LOC115457318 [Microcaecilia unicolor]|uniref:Uncharacterized protein LOC115457318 n=1 Tax=Microcaecilia unicolor TaxID=1415580 RepID=A0A6P7WQE6_9AMPH|nr:uncharacterized protein LOC115457318 [Microcaecilia unicolor]